MDEDAYKKHNKPESGAQPGVYKHPDTKDELHITSFPAADAVVRQGWEYDRPLPKPTDAADPAPGSGTNFESKKDGK
jgi:hypothetical protein